MKRRIISGSLQTLNGEFYTQPVHKLSFVLCDSLLHDEDSSITEWQ